MLTSHDHTTFKHRVMLQVRTWNIQNLPSDDLSVENGLMAGLLLLVLCFLTGCFASGDSREEMAPDGRSPGPSKPLGPKHGQGHADVRLKTCSGLPGKKHLSLQGQQHHHNQAVRWHVSPEIGIARFPEVEPET